MLHSVPPVVGGAHRTCGGSMAGSELEKTRADDEDAATADEVFAVALEDVGLEVPLRLELDVPTLKPKTEDACADEDTTPDDALEDVPTIELDDATLVPALEPITEDVAAKDVAAREDEGKPADDDEDKDEDGAADDELPPVGTRHAPARHWLPAAQSPSTLHGAAGGVRHASPGHATTAANTACRKRAAGPCVCNVMAQGCHGTGPVDHNG